MIDEVVKADGPLSLQQVSRAKGTDEQPASHHENALRGRHPSKAPWRTYMPRLVPQEWMRVGRAWL